nr:TraR/DksA C4-type zinc finger protein [Shewanella intestini]
MEADLRTTLNKALISPLMQHQAQDIDATSPLSSLIEQLSHSHLLDSELFLNFVQLDAAYCQLELGLYGICSDCESTISSQRLIANPIEQRCESCSRKHLTEHRQELRLNH